jgi:putative redox protein
VSAGSGVAVTLTWEQEGLRFRGGREGGPQVVIDSDGGEGPSPVTALLLGLGGCMAVDVLDITQKMRLPVTGLAVRIDAQRRPDPPRRLTAVRLLYVVRGLAVGDEPKVRHAIDLSRDKYCSVLHSLRDDIAMDIELELQ